MKMHSLALMRFSWSIASIAIVWVLAFLSANVCAEEGLATQLREAVQPSIESGKLAGAVMIVADRETVLLTETLGWADVEAKKPMQADTLFWIASQSKPITAAAVMVLVDEGRIKLDDPVDVYLPEFKKLWVVAEKDEEHILLKKADRPITVRDILSHVSGLPFKSALESPALDVFPLAARARSYVMTPLDFQPGTRYQYSNAGINLAGHIVEVVTGEPFEQFLQERLFVPLEMRDTTFWPSEDQLARLAKAYRRDQPSERLVEVEIGQLTYPLNDRQKRFPMPAGGLFATAEDLVHFYQMLLNGGTYRGKRILSQAAVEAMTSRQTPASVAQSYGLGLVINGPFFGHGGSHGTNTLADRNSGMIFVWLVQHAGPESQEVFQKVDRIFGEWCTKMRQ